LVWGECRFKDSCLEIRMKVNELATFEMSFNIKDSSTFYDNKFSIQIDDMQMLVDGAAFKDS
jgi:hypothetical protein